MNVFTAARLGFKAETDWRPGKPDYRLKELICEGFTQGFDDKIKRRADKLMNGIAEQSPKAAAAAAKDTDARFFHVGRAARQSWIHLKENWVFAGLWATAIVLNPNRTAFVVATAAGLGTSLYTWANETNRIDERKKEFCKTVRERLNHDKWMAMIFVSLLLTIRWLSANASLSTLSKWVSTLPTAVVPAAATVDYLTEELN